AVDFGSWHIRVNFHFRHLQRIVRNRVHQRLDLYPTAGGWGWQRDFDDASGRAARVAAVGKQIRPPNLRPYTAGIVFIDGNVDLLEAVGAAAILAWVNPDFLDGIILTQIERVVGTDIRACVQMEHGRFVAVDKHTDAPVTRTPKGAAGGRRGVLRDIHDLGRGCEATRAGQNHQKEPEWVFHLRHPVGTSPTRYRRMEPSLVLTAQGN